MKWTDAEGRIRDHTGEPMETPTATRQRQTAPQAPMDERVRLSTVGWVLSGAILLMLGIWSPDYLSHLAVMYGIYLLLGYSLNLTIGFGGLVVFCHASFYGAGAYAYALARLRSGGSAGGQVGDLLWAGSWDWLPGVLLGAFAGGLLAALTGWVCLRFRQDFFIFVTLGFQMIAFVVLYNWVELTKGPFGIYGIPRPELLGWMVDRPWEYVLLSGLVLSIVLPLLARLYRSPFGLALKTMREDEMAARSLGTDTTWLALQAMIIGGAVAGVAGSLYAGYVTYIAPTSFSLQESILLVTLLMLGGGGNLRGPLAGAAVLLLLPEALRFLGLPDGVAANVREVIYGLLLASLMLWRPQGLLGELTVK